MKKEDMYNRVTLLFSRNHNIVNQLYINKTSFKKVAIDTI